MVYVGGNSGESRSRLAARCSEGGVHPVDGGRTDTYSTPRTHTDGDFPLRGSVTTTEMRIILTRTKKEIIYRKNPIKGARASPRNGQFSGGVFLISAD